MTEGTGISVTGKQGTGISVTEGKEGKRVQVFL